jgi:hypothetical protein
VLHSDASKPPTSFHAHWPRNPGLLLGLDSRSCHHQLGDRSLWLNLLDILETLFNAYFQGL